MDCPKLTINRKNNNDVTICRYNVIFNSFYVVLFLLSSLVTSSGDMIILFYKGLTRNPEIGNTFVWVLPSIYRLGRVSPMKFYSMLQNAKVTAFTVPEDGGGGGNISGGNLPRSKKLLIIQEMLSSPKIKTLVF